MATYIILSRCSSEAFASPKSFKQLATPVSAKIKSECPDVVRKDSYTTLGRFGITDIVEAEEPKQIEKAAMILRTHSHLITETLAATPFEEFLARL